MFKSVEIQQAMPIFGKDSASRRQSSWLELLRRCLSYAKIEQAEDKGNLFTLLRCSLFYAKIARAEGNQAGLKC